MSLYKKWTDMVVEFVKEKGETAFWNVYGEIEKKLYTNVLSNHKDTIKGTVKDLAGKYDVTVVYFMGFLDGINDSLTKQIDLESVTEDTEVELNIDFEKLFFNMLDAKADYLYGLPQWDAIFSQEKRKDIQKQWRASKVVINPNKIGRNDPCPCGSGKKYKKCCGRNK